MRNTLPSLNHNCQSVLWQGTETLIILVVSHGPTARTDRKQVLLSSASVWSRNEMISHSVILFCWHTFQKTAGYNAAWNKCTALLKFRQLVGHFLIFSPLILLRYFRKTFKDMNLDLLLYHCLYAVSSPAKFEYYIQHFLGMAINLNLFERDDVCRCEYGEKKVLLDLLLSANRLTASPFPGTY